jgi:hypothetical protein
MIAKSLVLLYCLLTAASDAGGGTIAGTIVNASAEKTPVNRAEVVLRVQAHGETLICGETISNEQGRFAFHNLPQGEEYTYMPGANRDGVHYPGPRLHLTAQKPYAEVELSVCDSISAPSPLVIRRQDISMRFQSGALSVAESIIVDNPTQRCYVGACSEKDGEPITMQLAVPSNFERTTFLMEFFGRRFILLGDILVTSVPWPPGRHELKFTYVLPIQQGIYLWQRPLDLPCEQLRISIETNKADDVSCNLPAAPMQSSGKVVYQSHGKILPKGHVIRVELGHLPVPFMSYARWLAVTLLLVLFLIGGSLIFVRLRRTSHLQSLASIDAHKFQISSPKASRQSLRA